MTTVDLVYDADCPNVQAARANLLRAFVAVGREPRWREYRIGAEDLPDHARGYGSPTILVDQRDVGGTEPGSDACCRLYPESPGAPGVPPVEQITAALLGAGAGAPPAAAGRRGRGTFAVVPGIGIALLPKVACPACWPAYAGFLSSLGLGFLMDTAWLLPLTATFLVVAVGALGFRARRHRGLGPFAVGLAAAAVVLVGKFAVGSDPAMYAGVALLVAASIWNTWPARTPAATCPACAENPRSEA
ncbi:MAG: MerC domain-containing protein [Deltaproteobacteria bacterium]|nr:MerC domain-containing protein [Deltaproteobacteria bacterium]